MKVFFDDQPLDCVVSRLFSEDRELRLALELNEAPPSGLGIGAEIEFRDDSGTHSKTTVVRRIEWKHHRMPRRVVTVGLFDPSSLR